MAVGRLRVNEIFLSIQGESTRAGCPCVFVRLTGCHLRCVYCDTEYAFSEGSWMTVDDVVGRVCALGGPGGRVPALVEITGGEPLLQAPVHELTARLCDGGSTVLIETSGACDIGRCDPRAIRIMDLKTPASGECERNDLRNIDRLEPRDEVKFVIADRADYEWARSMIRRHGLERRCAAVLMSPVSAQEPGEEVEGCPGLEPRVLAEWILQDGLPVRLQLQLHKHIWHPAARGV
jgi:7-carboxy-7-deazaguanine synthase